MITKINEFKKILNNKRRRINENTDNDPIIDEIYKVAGKFDEDNEWYRYKSLNVYKNIDQYDTTVYYIDYITSEDYDNAGESLLANILANDVVKKYKITLKMYYTMRDFYDKDFPEEQYSLII